ncbi:unnamed protein product [Brassica rapa subsp. trilocularis]
MGEDGVATDSSPYNSLLREHFPDGDLAKSAKLI